MTHSSPSITGLSHPSMPIMVFSWGLVGTQKIFREDCGQTGESRLRKISGLNSSKGVAIRGRPWVCGQHFCAEGMVEQPRRPSLVLVVETEPGKGCSGPTTLVRT